MKMIRLTGLALIWVLAATMHAQSYKVLVNFNDEPSMPSAGIIAQSRGGYLLSMASSIEWPVPGVAFRITTSGDLTVLHKFDTTDGAFPSAGLTLARNGRSYGTTAGDGTDRFGRIFEMTPDGIVKTLHEFAGGADGGSPEAPPIQSLYGDFYGTTSGFEDDTHPGTVYKIDRFGDFTPLHAFTGPDGSHPFGSLVQATNYWFYGTTEDGGTHGAGTIFRISHSGEFEVLFNFDVVHGAFPYAGLIQANDGNFYGVTAGGGAHFSGVVFRMTPTHQVTVLHDFTGGADGAEAYGGLVQATDGNLYGTTSSGGDSGWGVLFRINTTTGQFSILHSFDLSSGGDPQGLIQHTNGFLYGDTYSGGAGFRGVFFRFDLGLSPFVTYLPSYGRVGMTVDILGEYFTANSEVFFNGVPAQITMVEPTYMRVVVPDGATSGFITVTTAKGTLKSNKVFPVRP
jgi:uncharacterized repeat protein (TIGR03803 family)